MRSLKTDSLGHMIRMDDHRLTKKVIDIETTRKQNRW